MKLSNHLGTKSEGLLGAFLQLLDRRLAFRPDRLLRLLPEPAFLTGSSSTWRRDEGWGWAGWATHVLGGMGQN